MAENLPRSTPARVLLLFAFLFAGVVAAVWRDGQMRPQLESVVYPTALGDALEVPPTVLAGAVFQAWTDADPGGASFKATAEPPLKLAPDRLLRAGAAADGAFWLYRPDAKSGRQGLFLRMPDGQFLPLAKQ
ncbi:MAG: hypothetical protein KA004_12610 [Verrucomicrobiales bacterium]|nr:hypothetical protein [Verrucomicrobiales bacterium]